MVFLPLRLYPRFKDRTIGPCRFGPSRGRCQPATPGSVAALFSCSEKEVSWEDAELDGGHGVFFHSVIEGLKGDADVDGNHDGHVSLLELTEYTQRAVSAFVRQKHATSQLPRLRGDIGPVTLIDVTARLAQSRTITNSIGKTLTLIKAGEFMMGSDATDADAFDDEFLDKAAGRKEKHRVRIPRPFHLGVTEVTCGQFRRFVDFIVRGSPVLGYGSCVHGPYHDSPVKPVTVATPDTAQVPDRRSPSFGVCSESRSAFEVSAYGERGRPVFRSSGGDPRPGRAMASGDPSGLTRLR